MRGDGAPFLLLRRMRRAETARQAARQADRKTTVKTCSSDSEQQTVPRPSLREGLSVSAPREKLARLQLSSALPCALEL